MLGEKAYAVGLMSGTSVDGIDAAVVEISTTDFEDIEVRLLAFENTPFPEETRNQIFQLFDPAKATVDKVGMMNVWLGELYANATHSIIQRSGLTPDQIAVIGSHGQTIYHAPWDHIIEGQAVQYTVQIGEGSVIANRTGIPCVSDFRTADMAVGGQGAPLVPFTEYLLYRSESKTILLQNIGGIGNITVLPAGCAASEVYAFDTGPGNMIIDGIVSKLYAPLKMDIGGAIAAKGEIIDELLHWLKQDEYYSQPLPKSTGRERYGEQLSLEIIKKMKEHHWHPDDVVTTVTYVTAWSIYDSYVRYIEPEHPANELLVGGGGSYNQFLLQQLKLLFATVGVEVKTQEDIGGNSDAKEAVAFALLGYYALQRQPNNIPNVTGASRPVVMGKLSWPYVSSV